MKRWVIYCAGNADYVLSPNKEPIKMLKSFQRHFGEKLDYVYFTDKDEHSLDEVRAICEANNIKLVLGDCKQHYSNYRDYEFTVPRWPDAHYWYCEASDYFKGTYDYAIKCDGDMMCINEFDLTALETEYEITAAKEPSWYIPYDKFCPNAGFQIINVQNYSNNNIKQLFRELSDNSRQGTGKRFNGDTPVLDFLVGMNILNVHFLSAQYNYLLFDVPEVVQLTLNDVADVYIVHFVASKPHNLNREMIGSVKDYFANIYREY